jgi:hypothetical protein
MLYIFIFSLFVSAVNGYDGDQLNESGCPQAFGESCYCGMGVYRSYFPDRQVFITNCTNTGFKDANMLNHLDKRTEVLIFTGNHIPALPWNVFGVWKDYDNLTVVDLSNNGIKEIPGKSLHKVANVKRLILNHNDLYIVSTLSHPRVFSNFVNLKELHLTNAFTEQIVSQWYLLNLEDIFIGSALSKLEKLHLEQNEIWKISNPKLFCPLKSLMDLHLGDNQLTDINFDLGCLEHLRHLDIEYNKITNFNNQSLQRIDDVFGNASSGRSINMKGNPFRCDCQMKSFYDWFMSTSVKVSNREEVRCFDGFPKYNSGIRLANLKKLDCEYDTDDIEAKRYDSSDALIHTLSVIVALMAIALILTIVYIKRERLFPVLKTYTMQYSSIQKDEDKIPVNV